jgi:hypothetical protein
LESLSFTEPKMDLRIMGDCLVEGKNMRSREECVAVAIVIEEYASMTRGVVETGAKDDDEGGRHGRPGVALATWTII